MRTLSSRSSSWGLEGGDESGQLHLWARDEQGPLRAEVVEIVGEGFARQQAVFDEGEGARGLGGVGDGMGEVDEARSALENL